MLNSSHFKDTLFNFSRFYKVLNKTNLVEIKSHPFPVFSIPQLLATAKHFDMKTQIATIHDDVLSRIIRVFGEAEIDVLGRRDESFGDSPLSR